MKVKTLKVDFSKIHFKNPTTVNDSTNGHILQDGMINQGFALDKTGTVDIPGIGVEVKTRGSKSTASHTIGTMTYGNIMVTDWEDTTFCQKTQKQYRVDIDYNELDGTTTASGNLVDFSHAEIQKELKLAYETAKTALTQLGNLKDKKTIPGTQYGCLEHKEGNSYAFRIPHAGMKKLLNMANFTQSGLFEFE
jgi:hypothetical protein